MFFIGPSSHLILYGLLSGFLFLCCEFGVTTVQGFKQFLNPQERYVETSQLASEETATYDFDSIRFSQKKNKQTADELKKKAIFVPLAFNGRLIVPDSNALKSDYCTHSIALRAPPSI